MDRISADLWEWGERLSVVGYLKQIKPEVLSSLLEGMGKAQDYIYDEDMESLYLDKSWHAIHFILNGKAWGGEEPLAHVILGGTAISEDYGNGPIRYLSCEKVQEISNQLIQLQGAQLTHRYNPDKMTEGEIYPSLYWEDEGEMEYVFDYYWSVVDYYKDAASKGNGMLMYLS